MKPYTPNTNVGRKQAVDDIHHKTADQPRADARAAAKAARHAARQEAKLNIVKVEDIDPDRPYALTFKPGSKVIFTQEALDKCAPQERKRLERRIACVTGYRLGASDPIIVFPKEGRRPELKIIEAPANRLELAPEQSAD